MQVLLMRILQVSPIMRRVPFFPEVKIPSMRIFFSRCSHRTGRNCSSNERIGDNEKILKKFRIFLSRFMYDTSEFDEKTKNVLQHCEEILNSFLFFFPTRTLLKLSNNFPMLTRLRVFHNSSQGVCKSVPSEPFHQQEGIAAFPLGEFLISNLVC